MNVGAALVSGAQPFEGVQPGEAAFDDPALFAQAAEYVPAQYRTERPQYLERQAEALRRQGDERGDNAALLQSMSAYRALLDEWPRDRMPLAHEV